MTATTLDQEVAHELLARVIADLEMVTDHEIRLGEPECGWVTERPAGKGCVHISFKHVYQGPGDPRWGCLLVPLPDALALAGYLMMVPDEAVEKRRGDTELDPMTKDALLEVSNFVGTALDAAVRERFGDGNTVRSDGCQGVRADVRPAFPYEEGDDLLVARATASVGGFPEFELQLLIPSQPGSLDPGPPEPGA